jgi:glycerol-1-phosphate dehydrogenase [NAD(P)+]
MKMLEKYHKAPSHGATVGVATLMVYPVFKKIAGANLSGVDVESLAPMPENERRSFMVACYGKTAAETIMEENPGDFLTAEEMRRRAARGIERFSEIRSVIDEMPSYDQVYQAMKRLGAPLSMAEIGVDRDIEETSMRCAKDYRTRYTLFKLIDEMGLTGDYIGK